jgi:hypothetical protein
MSFAPYYNTSDMNQPRLLGALEIAKFGATYEYSARPDGDRQGMWPGYPHRIFTIDGDRAALVLKTVAYVITDELEDGSPVFEKWELKRHKAYA